MTTKDWKKVGRSGMNFEKNNIRLNISKARIVYSNPFEAYKRKLKDSFWSVEVIKMYTSHFNTLVNKRFKTKKQAIAYAKAYMRKH